MKTTLEIPDAVFRHAKEAASRRGQPLRQFITQAVEEKLRAEKERSLARPWMNGFGAMKELSSDTRRIQKRIDEAFSQVDSEGW